MTVKNMIAKKPKITGLGLEKIGDLSSLLNEREAAGDISRPLELALDLIDEDPDQPRTKDNPGFSVESLEELAMTIRLRGVKTPISVRPHPETPGRFIINHGARRMRASKLAEKDTIPAFIDDDHNVTDQVIENLHRDELTAREIANFIGREIAKGIRKSAIAKAIGKSPAFVTQHITLLDLPEPIAKAFNAGRAKDVTAVNELVAAYKEAPDEVVSWLADDTQELTRGSTKLLREFLNDKRKREDSERDPDITDDFIGEVDDDDRKQKTQGSAKAKEPDPDRLKKSIVQVQHDDRPARLILNRRPSVEGWAWLKYEDDGQEFEADLAQVQLVALMEG